MVHFWDGRTEADVVERVVSPLERLEELLEAQAREDAYDARDEVEFADAIALTGLLAQFDAEARDALAASDKVIAFNRALMACITHGRRYEELMALNGLPLPLRTVD